MLKNYLKIAFRNLQRKKGYSFITITGLALGLACCLIILSYVKQETSFDRFHEKADRIYRVHLTHTGSSGERISQVSSNYALAPILKDNFPQVQEAVRLARIEEKVSKGELAFKEDRFFYTDPGIFEAFTVKMLVGDAETALYEPMSVVLTKRTSQKYFGTQNPIGEELGIDDEYLFTLTAVVEKFPVNSHVRFDFLANIESSCRWKLCEMNNFTDNYK